MKVLVVGSGGREAALVWKLSQSTMVTELFCAPGNGGIATYASCVPIKAIDIDGMIKFSKENSIDFVVVAPDDPLSMGMVDALEAEGIKAFGPNKAAAQIESSKAFSKRLMKKYGIPTALYEEFDCPDKADEYLKGCDYPIVVKADGLALGKGVIICQNKQEALKAIDEIMRQKVFGNAGDKAIIEEFMVGPEISILAFTDGKTILPMVSAQDHKRALDNDCGLNTGGMGTFAPSPKYTREVAEYTEKYIMKPTIDAMAAEGCPFKGVLYFGLMLTEKGIKVLEYNARFGDPETQVILPLMFNDLMEIMLAVSNEKLDEIKLNFDIGSAVCVVLASGGYPEKYESGKLITGLDKLDMVGCIAFHAGTKKENGKIYTSGGRVLGVCAVADCLEDAISFAYEGVETVQFENMHYRKDIGIK